MYRVEWLDEEGEIRIKRGFETSEAAHAWIVARDFHKHAYPMVFCD